MAQDDSDPQPAPIRRPRQDDPFADPAAAYAEAEQRIAKAMRSGETELVLGNRYLRSGERAAPPLTGLDRLPPSIAGLTALQRLWLDRTGVADLAPLAGLTALQQLTLGGTRVADLVPLAGLTGLSDAAANDTEPVTDGLYFADTPVSRVSPFDAFVRAEQPATTVETINYLRRQKGLPAHIPEGYQRADADPPPAKPEPTLPQQKLAVRYAVPEDGPIDLDRGAVLSDTERSRLAGLQQEMLEAISELAELIKSSNGYTALAPSIDKYHRALNHPVADLRDGDIEILYARGLRIQDAYEKLQIDIAKGLAPPEDIRLSGPMRSLLSLHGPFLQATNRGQELYDQTDRDLRNRQDELALKERQTVLNELVAKEVAETATRDAREEVADTTDLIAEGRHPERASVSGRNTVNNWWIAFATLARRWVRQQTASPGRAAATVGKLAGGGVATALAGKIAVTSKAGSALIAAGAAALDAALGTGASLSHAAADFMVRHAGELRALARAGGASFEWLASFVDWLEAALKGKVDK